MPARGNHHRGRLNRQNEAVKALGEETARRQARSAAALATAARDAARARRDAAAILARPTPPDACEAALALIRER